MKKPLIFWKCCCGLSPSTILSISKKIRIHIIFGSLAAKVPLTVTRATFSPASSHWNRPWHALFFLSYSLLSLLVCKESSGTHSNYKEVVNNFRLIDCRMTHNRALQVRVMAFSNSKCSCCSLSGVPGLLWFADLLSNSHTVGFPQMGCWGIAKRKEYSLLFKGGRCGNIDEAWQERGETKRRRKGRRGLGRLK